MKSETSLSLQSTLFNLTPPEARKRQSKLRPSKPSPKDDGGDDFVATLFGQVETKSATHKRAKRIAYLLSMIHEAPEEIAWYQNAIPTLGYFLKRSRKVALTLNDLDGLNRFVVDMSELLNDADYQQLKRRKIWKPVPPGWIGCRPGGSYRAALHRKEMEHLRMLQNDCRDSIEEIQSGVKEGQVELERLRSLGPLSPDIAARYGLTPEGFAKKK